MGRSNRALFILTILVGSFLLFMVEPMVARMALPRLGGAPNVWNSAMLVYQALLLAGYGYAHWLSRKPLWRQAVIHLIALCIAATTLPIALAQVASPAPGWEAIWVPWLLLLTVGPVFFLIAAQAPLMQRWFAADSRAGQPWALYAASNLGSFAGLVAYPLVAEPLLALHGQSLVWAVGYGLLILLVAACAWSRRKTVDAARPSAPLLRASEVTSWRRKLHWLALAAIPSGLMLSTTTHLTTDIFASPLLWVIPLGLYLLSFVVAFADRRVLAGVLTFVAPVVLLFTGSYAMLADGSGALLLAGGSCVLLFVVSVALHARLYDLRPDAGHLTGFYLIMSAGGALGGLFTALVAPLVFDWSWEHPLLILGAALLVPLDEILRWRRMEGLDQRLARIALVLLLLLALFLSVQLFDLFTEPGTKMTAMLLTVFLTGTGVMVMGWRWAFVAVLLLAMLGQGGLLTIMSSYEGQRTRSYFGIYTVRDYRSSGLRILSHGTTLHGQQSLDPDKRRMPLTYYGPRSGVGLALASADRLEGDSARIGVVGLGTGSLACYARPGQDWTFFEIDPVILHYSTSGKFTYLRDCAPRARVILGDARLELEAVPPRRFDMLVIDAFSSDAIPLHLLTQEALQVYLRALSERGVLLMHISNRYVELEPVIAALARSEGLTARVRQDWPENLDLYTPSHWIALSRDSSSINELAKMHPDSPWSRLQAPAQRPWTDDHASILPFIRWSRLIGYP
ncbi:fused MFS/spermidine synthase [Novosphingobium pentaromativorans]|uniref:Spermidine synthase n=1 Tax=Novosphingobium pentaromativorans US6-1 TaxID=1088721 RepID=G6EBJ8_9SPHN|nr:fused MFS/spermidine synthase [Novosphingobium pentaromativorans]AIT80356.1 hypothetical protein JI59_11485 [Novosphingobium pentaromativorans US6-1]EHJ61280.1 hypothetical protein NSU_1719 [Novosphingobium pentaromativorans US6-1]